MPTSHAPDDAVRLAALSALASPDILTPAMSANQSANHGVPLTLSWRWPPGLMGLSGVNFLLRLVTFGIYHFWGKAEVRRRLWSAIRLNGEPLTYTGTGGELFFGFVFVSLFVFLPLTLSVVGVMIVFGPESPVFDAATSLFYVPIMFLYGVAIFRSTRYRLMRTRWRGIRGSLAGHSGYYGWTFFWTLIVTGLTLGWASPWRSTKLQSILVTNMHFGDRALRFTATSGPLYVRFAIAWLATIVVCIIAGIASFIAARSAIEDFMARGGVFKVPPLAGAVIVPTLAVAVIVFIIIATWYRAHVTNHFANHTHYEQATLSSRITARGLLWITLSNFMISLAGVAIVGALVGAVGLITYHALGGAANKEETELFLISTLPIIGLIVLGLGYSLFSPITQARSTSYFVRNLAITGTAPLAEIRQAAAVDAKYGEGLAQAFDVDAF